MSELSRKPTAHLAQVVLESYDRQFEIKPATATQLPFLTKKPRVQLRQVKGAEEVARAQLATFGSTQFVLLLAVWRP
jgi:hypothetical protein